MARHELAPGARADQARTSARGSGLIAETWAEGRGRHFDCATGCGASSKNHAVGLLPYRREYFAPTIIKPWVYDLHSKPWAGVMKNSPDEVMTPLKRHAVDALRRARKLPIGPHRNDLRQLAIGLRRLDSEGIGANFRDQDTGGWGTEPQYQG